MWMRTKLITKLTKKTDTRTFSLWTRGARVQRGGIAKLSSRNWRKRKGNFSPRIKRREAKKDRKGWNRMGRIYQTDYTIKIRRRFNKSENHWVSMLDQPASGGLIKYNPHPPPSNVVAPLVARVKRAIFLAEKKKPGWSRIRPRYQRVRRVHARSNY